MKVRVQLTAIFEIDISERLDYDAAMSEALRMQSRDICEFGTIVQAEVHAVEGDDCRWCLHPHAEHTVTDRKYTDGCERCDCPFFQPPFGEPQLT